MKNRHKRVPDYLDDAFQKVKKERNLSQTEIADELGFETPNMISMIKLGSTLLPIPLIAKLAKILDLDCKQFAYDILRLQRPEYFKLINDLCGSDWHLIDSADPKLLLQPSAFLYDKF